MTPFTSMTARITFQRKSLVDDTIYGIDYDALTTEPEIYDRVARELSADENFEGVSLSFITTL